MSRVADALNSDVISSALKRILALPDSDARNDKSAANLALKIAITLENYAAVCMNIVLDNRIDYNEGLPAGELRKSLPELGPLYLSDDGWRSMNRALAAEISGFTDALALADATVAAACAIDAPSPAWAICSEHCAELGQRAAILATNIRQAHGQSDATPDWDRRDRLAIEMRRIEEDEAAWQARRVETERAQTERPGSR